MCAGLVETTQRYLNMSSRPRRQTNVIHELERSIASGVDVAPALRRHSLSPDVLHRLLLHAVTKEHVDPVRALLAAGAKLDDTIVASLLEGARAARAARRLDLVLCIDIVFGRGTKMRKFN